MSEVAAFPVVDEKREGVTFAQAMEILRLFNTDDAAQRCPMAAPTIAHNMGIEFKTVVKVLDGRVWPGARFRYRD